MIKVVGVRFRGSGKLYWFDPGGFEIRPGAHVIAETARGLEYGTVSGTLRELAEDKVTQPLRSIVRVANEEDEARSEENHRKEREAFAVCKEKIRKHGLEMKLIDAEYTFDNSKILFYFTADGRVDFRELVKDLAGVFRTRIELRQIGVRDETKILGGIGICGRPLCCHTWLTDFVPVSIKMAKEQSLSLNPAKISGVCGRLMCCLKNEEETYEYLNSRLPAVGDTVITPAGNEGVVNQVNVLRQTVRVVIVENDEKEACEYDVEELIFQPRKGKNRKDGRKDPGREGKKERAKEEKPQKERGRSGKNKSEKDNPGSGMKEKESSEQERADRERPGKEHPEKERQERAEKDRPGKERQERDVKENAGESRDQAVKERPESDGGGKDRPDQEAGAEEKDRRGNRNRRGRYRKNGKNERKGNPAG